MIATERYAYPGKGRVKQLHPSAICKRNDEGWYDVRAGEKLLGQGSNPTSAWWDADMACFPDRRAVANADVPAPLNAWPFPVSAHEERA